MASSSPQVSDRRQQVARYAPFVIGGAAVVIGLALGIGSGGGDSATPASTTTATVAAAGSASDGGAEASDGARYQPDLSGADVGELVTKTEGPANGLALVGARLLWLATDRSRLSQVLAGGGEPELLFESDQSHDFGGAMTNSASGVYWVVENEDGEAAPIYFVAPPRGKPRRVAAGGSPDNLAVIDGKLHWSDRGSLMRIAAGPEQLAQQLAERDKRIAALAGDARALYWLEIDYQAGAKGAHQLMTLDDDEQPRKLEHLKPTRERSELVVRGDELAWVERGPQDAWVLRSRGIERGPVRTLTQTGEVSALSAHDGALYWAESWAAAGDAGGAVTLLRRMKKGASRAERLGRMTGQVTALLVTDTTLYASSSRGIMRLSLP